MATHILHIDSSARYDGSVTRDLSAAAVAQLKTQYPAATVTYRDLMKEPLPHIDPVFLAATYSGLPPSDPAADAALARAQMLVDEILKADILVIGAPMYNFSIPTTLKAWIDHISLRGKTFAYTETGPKGLITGKRAIVLSATGGIYGTGPMTSYDHVTPYMRQFLGFIGITDTEVIIAEQQALGPDAAAATVATAKNSMVTRLVKAA